MGDKNMFAYCGNNPIMRCDPTGERAYPIGFIGPIQPGDTYYNPKDQKPSTAPTIPKQLNNAAGFADKAQNRRPDTGLKDIPDDEISRRAKDKSLPSSERKRYQTEEKVRGNRNKQKRGNKIESLLPDIGIVSLQMMAAYNNYVQNNLNNISHGITSSFNSPNTGDPYSWDEFIAEYNDSNKN